MCVCVVERGGGNFWSNILVDGKFQRYDNQIIKWQALPTFFFIFLICSFV